MLFASPARIAAMVNAKEAQAFFPGDAATAQRLGLDATLEVAAIQQVNPEVLMTCWSTPPLPEKWLLSAECNLRYVCHLTGSVRHFLPRSFIERGGRVTNWGDVPSIAVAEHAVLLALAALRNLPAWPQVFGDASEATDRMQRLGARTLRGSRVGLHGFGRVARALVKLLTPFEVKLTAFSHGLSGAVLAEHGVQPAPSLRELYRGNDVLFVCEALTPHTERSVGTGELAALPDDAVLVNVARGGLIDEAALLREAKRRRVRVALDVFTTEPLPADSPWFQAPNAVLSPHIAGPTSDQYPRCGQLALDNLCRYLRGEPLTFVVTTDVYDRAT